MGGDSKDDLRDDVDKIERNADGKGATEICGRMTVTDTIVRMAVVIMIVFVVVWHKYVFAGLSCPLLQSLQQLPAKASFASRNNNGTIAKHAAESSHHQRRNALATRPANKTQLK